MENQRELAKNRRVILFPWPLQGHITPMLQLADILYTNGFSITMIHTHFNSPNTENYPHFTFHPISDRLSEQAIAIKDLMSLITSLNLNCIEPFRECLVNLLSSGSQNELKSCLITDVVWQFPQLVAKELNVPRIALNTSSISSFIAFDAVTLLLEKGYLPKQDSQLDEPLYELTPLRVKDFPVINTPYTNVFCNVINSQTKETKNSSGIIWNSFEELEQSSLVKIRQDLTPPSFLIGPFHKYSKASSSSLRKHDESTIPWLDKQAHKSVIYVSFGSIAATDEKEFLELAWGLAHSKQPFLWVVRSGPVHGSEWLEWLPNDFLKEVGERGHIVKWAPQQEVLAHKSIGGFWTHNGWNSTLESICEGVPMICLPCFGDQLVNARYVTDVWKVGIRFENALEREAVAKMIRRLMVEKEGEEISERIQGLKEKVNQAITEGGSSHENLENLVKHLLSL